MEPVRRTSLPKGYVNWVRIAIPHLELGHIAYMLFLQGMAPTQFFLSSSLRAKDAIHSGPLLFLKGTLSAAWRPTPAFENLILGRLYDSGKDDLNVVEVFQALSHAEARRSRG